ncbi:MAG: mitochondrial fission ELM1 family protein [Desulfobacteraceae bacterium]|nr:mitochondrial fission ELM1 family protein [Desulfobacteraceae bacterium]
MRPPHPLAITAFYDTRPGHVKQTRGLIQALEEFTQVQVQEVYLPDYTAWRNVWDWARFITVWPGKKKTAPPAPALILGTGTHTHIPMLLHRDKKSGKAVTCMTPGWPLTQFMDLCFIPEHDAPKKQDHIVTTLGPPNTAVNRHTHDPLQGLIVLGGKDRKTHHWDNDKIMDQVRQIIEKQPHMSWTLSTSPRTPPEMVPMLVNLTRHISKTTVVPFEDTGPGWIETRYAKASAVWVSADSVSMVYEALTAGCRVGILSVDWKKKGHRLARGIDILAQKKKIISFETFMKNTAYPAHSQLNEARRCAREMLKRWWPDRLQ